MSAVSRIDKGYGGVICRNNRCTLFRMTHRDNVHIVGNRCDGVRYTFSLCSGRACRSGKSEDGAAEFQHCRLKGQSGSGRRFKEEGRELLMLTAFPVILRLCFNLVRKCHEFIQFLHTQVQNVNDTAIFLHPFVLSHHPFTLYR